jgi:hypothetical protein
VADTGKSGPYESWLEAGLALAAVEAAGGNRDAARRRLDLLGKEARTHGFGLADRKAEAALRGTLKADQPPDSRR